MKRIKIAFPTEGDQGIKDVVSDVFGRAKSFTLVEISGDTISGVEVVENPAGTYRHGAGPIVIKTLADMGVNAVAARELGPGASALVEHHGMRRFMVRSGVSVEEAVKDVLKQTRKG